MLRSKTYAIHSASCGLCSHSRRSFAPRHQPRLQRGRRARHGRRGHDFLFERRNVVGSHQYLVELQQLVGFVDRGLEQQRPDIELELQQRSDVELEQRKALEFKQRWPGACVPAGSHCGQLDG